MRVVPAVVLLFGCCSTAFGSGTETSLVFPDAALVSPQQTASSSSSSSRLQPISLRLREGEKEGGGEGDGWGVLSDVLRSPGGPGRFPLDLRDHGEKRQADREGGGAQAEEEGDGWQGGALLDALTRGALPASSTLPADAKVSLADLQDPSGGQRSVRKRKKRREKWGGQSEAHAILSRALHTATEDEQGPQSNHRNVPLISSDSSFSFQSPSPHWEAAEVSKSKQRETPQSQARSVDMQLTSDESAPSPLGASLTSMFEGLARDDGDGGGPHDKSDTWVLDLQLSDSGGVESAPPLPGRTTDPVYLHASQGHPASFTKSSQEPSRSTKRDAVIFPSRSQPPPGISALQTDRHPENASLQLPHTNKKQNIEEKQKKTGVGQTLEFPDSPLLPASQRKSKGRLQRPKERKRQTPPSEDPRTEKRDNHRGISNKNSPLSFAVQDRSEQTTTRSRSIKSTHHQTQPDDQTTKLQRSAAQKSNSPLQLNKPHASADEKGGRAETEDRRGRGKSLFLEESQGLAVGGDAAAGGEATRTAVGEDEKPADHVWVFSQSKDYETHLKIKERFAQRAQTYNDGIDGPVYIDPSYEVVPVEPNLFEFRTRVKQVFGQMAAEAQDPVFDSTIRTITEALRNKEAMKRLAPDHLGHPQVDERTVSALLTEGLGEGAESVKRRKEAMNVLKGHTPLAQAKLAPFQLWLLWSVSLERVFHSAGCETDPGIRLDLERTRSSWVMELARVQAALDATEKEQLDKMSPKELIGILGAVGREIIFSVGAASKKTREYKAGGKGQGMDTVQFCLLLGQGDCVGRMLRAGANPNAKNDRGENMMHLTTQTLSSCDSQVLGWLFLNALALGPRGETLDREITEAVNAKNPKGITPLVQLLKTDMKPWTEDGLLKRSGYPTFSVEGNTNSDWMIFENLQRIFDSLLDIGADIQETDPFSGRSTLHLALFPQFVWTDGGRALVLRLLRQYSKSLSQGRERKGEVEGERRGREGSWVNWKDKFGQTPLHYLSITCASSNLVNAMVASGADPMIRDVDGLLPAHYAVVTARLQCISAILDHTTISTPGPMTEAQKRQTLHDVALLQALSAGPVSEAFARRARLATQKIENRRSEDVRERRGKSCRADSPRKKPSLIYRQVQGVSDLSEKESLFKKTRMRKEKNSEREFEGEEEEKNSKGVKIVYPSVLVSLFCLFFAFWAS